MLCTSKSPCVLVLCAFVCIVLWGSAGVGGVVREHAHSKADIDHLIPPGGGGANCGPETSRASPCTPCGADECTSFFGPVQHTPIAYSEREKKRVRGRERDSMRKKKAREKLADQARVHRAELPRVQASLDRCVRRDTEG